MIITIDGPAGSGKSTTAKLLAKKLGGIYLDTGAMYRSVTLLALDEKTDPADAVRVAEISQTIKLEFVDSGDGQLTFINGKDRTPDIRTREVDTHVSVVAANPKVRNAMVPLQRDVAGENKVVVGEGRDLGSVVFPKADYKFYLNADPARRAERRAIERGETLDEARIEEIRRRDHLDSTRAESPLKIPDGAIVIDNTELSVDDTIAKILEFIA